MMTKSKIFGLTCLLSALCACSSNKDIPQGKRISVLTMPEKVVSQTSNTDKSFKLSTPVENKSWNQSGANALHLTQNILAKENMKKSWTASFSKGSSKRNLLLAEPVIAGSTVYIQDVNATVYAFNLETGKEIFKQKLKSLNKNDSSSALNGIGLAVNNNTLYALAGFGSVFALNAQNGDILWRKDLKVPLRTPPTVANKLLFVQTLDNQLLALDVSDGSEIWTYNMSSEDTVLAGLAAPAYSAEKQIVVAAFSNGELQAFNALIGYPLWSNTLINTKQIGASLGISAIKALPVIDGNTVYAVGSNGLTVAINIETGEILWERYISGTNTPVVDSDAMFILSDNFELFAINKKTGETFWKKQLFEDLTSKQKNKLYLSGPLLVNSKLLITSSDGKVYTFDPKNGDQKSELNLGKDLPFGPVVAKQTIIFTTNNAKLISFK